MDRQYLITERAHLMCPHMHFGLLISINEKYNLKCVQKTLQSLSKAYPSLKSVIARDDSEKLYYSFQEQSEISIMEKTAVATLQEDYRSISEMGWDVFHEGLLKVVTYPKTEGFDLLFIAHHLLCDGRGLWELAQSFADFYVKCEQPVSMEVCTIQSFKDFSVKCDLPWISKLVVNSANKKWKKEAHTVDYSQYRIFEKNYIKQNPITMHIETKDSTDVERILILCHENQVSVNDYLIANMMLESHTDKVLIAADIRKYVSVYQKGSIGNFSTAFSVVCNTKETDVWRLAQNVSKVVKQYMKSPQKLMLVLACYLRMCPGLIDAAAISALGDYPSEAGNFVGSKMFGYKSQDGCSITNLGKCMSDTIEKAVFIPPASPANRKTLGIVTVNKRMSVCTMEASGNIKDEKN